MTIWKPPSVEEEPDIYARNWQVIEITMKKEKSKIEKWKMIICSDHNGGRISSALEKWDEKNRIATTYSGRKYKLDKNSIGVSNDGMYVFNVRLNATKKAGYEIDYENISEKYT